MRRRNLPVGCGNCTLLQHTHTYIEKYSRYIFVTVQAQQLTLIHSKDSSCVVRIEARDLIFKTGSREIMSREYRI